MMSTEIRLAEDQIQRLMLGVCAVGMLILDKDREDATYAQAWESGRVMLEYEPKPEPASNLIPENSATFENFKRLLTENACLQSNLDAANDMALTARQENEDLRKRLTKLTVLNDTLQAQVPKERLKVQIVELCGGNGYTYHVISFPMGNRISDHSLTKEEAEQWIMERCLEVIE